MKHHAWMRVFLCLFAMTFCFLPPPALADDAGVLTEGELNAWIVQVLNRSKEEQPQNAPISEESLTEDGYAFIYSFATLYYDKPVLDSKSVLNGFTITDENFETPRGIRLGMPSTLLVASYGWQNPSLVGDETFAAFYLLDQLPQNVYWCWAQHEAESLSSVQCAIHVRVGTDAYTDAGIRYQVQKDEITSIHVYGLSRTVTVADVESNIAALIAVQAAGSGDDVPISSLTAAGNYTRSTAPEFGASDLQFNGLDFNTLTEETATKAFGPALEEETVQDDTGEWLHNTQREGLTLTYALDQNQQNPRLEVFSTTSPNLEGPRGMRIGNSLNSVIGLFRSDGTGDTEGSEALLYGDGDDAPYGTLEILMNVATLRYATRIQGANGAIREIVLHLTFVDSALAEIMIYEV